MIWIGIGITGLILIGIASMILLANPNKNIEDDDDCYN